jgi:diguanylate cyclase (GGDEF)-like protein
MSAQSFFQDPGGAVWVGSSRGLSRFDANRLPQAEGAPRAILIQARFGDQEIALQGPMPRVPHLRNTFQVQFSTLSFAQEGAVQHQARILGLDEVWRTPEGRSQIYPGLPPGTFVFQVRSRIGAGAWGPAAELRFEILPAWWQRAWAKGALLLGLVSLVGALFQGRMARLRRHNQHLETMVEVRTRQVQDKARELELANAALLDQSLTDPLTGAHNRRYLGQCLPQDVAQVRRAYDGLQLGRSRMADNLDLQFIMIDLDWFKRVNDVHGHAAGDLVLQEIAALLRQCLRETDSLTRWGGEEFLIVARNTNQPMAAQVAERIRAAVEAHDFILADGTVLRRTVSIGFAFYPFTAGQPDLFEWQKVIDLADLAMYAAKRGGRNAWIGIVAAPEADPVRLQAGVPHGLQALLDEGQVQILSCLPPDSVFHWDEAKVEA